MADKLFIERREQGDYAIRRPNSDRASDVLPTEAEANRTRQEYGSGCLEGANADDLKDFFALRRAWHQSELRLRELEASPNVDISALKSMHNTLEGKYLESLETARKRFSDLDYDPDCPVLPATFAQIQKAVEILSRDAVTVLIQYHVANDRIYIFAILPKRDGCPNTFVICSKSVLSPDQMLALSSRWTDGYGRLRGDGAWISLPHWEKGYLQQLLARLKFLAVRPEKTIAAWESDTGCTVERVIIAPHRFLHLIPIHAIPLTPAETWCERRTIHYVPSGSVLCRLVDRQESTCASVRDSGTICSRPVGITVTSTDDPPPFSRHEVRSAIRALGGRILEGSGAFRTRVVEAIKNTDYIHFACHGIHDTQHPWDSGLLISDDPSDSTSAEEKYLPLTHKFTLAEIFEQVHFSAFPIVILSACETGITKIEGSHDEYIGLPAGFLYAGARTVVSSLWPVDDLASCLLMRRFAHELASGATVSEALRYAQKWLRNLPAKAVLKDIDSMMRQERDQTQREKMAFRRLSVAEMSSQEPFPFVSPYWWSGFIVSGLG